LAKRRGTHVGESFEKEKGEPEAEKISKDEGISKVKAWKLDHLVRRDSMGEGKAQTCEELKQQRAGPDKSQPAYNGSKKWPRWREG